MPIDEYNVDYREKKSDSEWHKTSNSTNFKRVEKEVHRDDDIIFNPTPIINSRLSRILVAISLMFIAVTGVIVISYMHDGNFDLKAVSSLSDKNVFEKLISSVVMQDPEPFEKIEDADKNMLVASSLWYNIMTQNIKDFDDNGYGLISEEDMLKSFDILFGEQCRFPVSNDIKGDFFSFDDQKRIFCIKPYSNQSSFIPYIEDMNQEEDIVKLKVGYVSPNDEWRSLKSNKPSVPNPAKHKIYELKNMHIFSVKD